MDEHEVEPIGLFYNREDNVFIDDDFGNEVTNIFEFITPNDLYLFHLHKQYMIVRHRSQPGVICELYYPMEVEDYYYFRDIFIDYS